MVGPVYDALLPYAGLLNAGGGLNAGLPVDDVLGRLAALAGDVRAAVRHARTPWRWPARCRRHRCSCTASIISATRSPCRATTLPTLTGTRPRPWRRPSASSGPAGVPAPTARDDGGRAATMRRDGHRLGGHVAHRRGPAPRQHRPRTARSPAVDTRCRGAGDRAGRRTGRTGGRRPRAGARRPGQARRTGSGCSSCRPKSTTRRPATTQYAPSGPTWRSTLSCASWNGRSAWAAATARAAPAPNGLGSTWCAASGGRSLPSSSRLPNSGRISR